MQGLEFFSALRKRWLYVLVPVVLGLLAAAGLNLFTPAVYKSTATVYFSLPTFTNSASDLFNGSNYTQKQLASYAGLATQPVVLNPVIKQLGLKRTAAGLAGSVNPIVSTDTVLVGLEVSDGSATEAADIANAVATQLGVEVQLLAPKGSTGLVPVSAKTVAPALPSASPASPKQGRNLLAGGLGGILLGLLLAIGRERLDNKVRSSKDLPSGVAVLGHVGFDKTARKYPVVGEGHRRRAEAFRKLRTNLQFVDVDKPIKVMVVTSSVPGEGKSSTAANLAVVFAEAGHNVLIVEADMRRPRVSEYLGLDSSVGLSDVLAGQVSLGDALQKWGSTELTELTVLPSGTVPPNPSELLGSQAMVALMDSLRATFDTVIVDTPPLLPVTDAAVVAAQADGVVLVARYAKVSHGNLAETVNLLQAVDARIFGVILNMAPAKGPDARRYNGYGYYEDDAAAKRSADARM